MQAISRERIELVARVYPSNKEASRALGVTPWTFGRLCRHYGVESPYERRRRRHRLPEWSPGLD